MFGFLKKIFGMDAPETPLQTLFSEVNTMGRKERIMPVEMFGLSTRLAEAEERDEVIAMILKDFIAHKSLFVRRTAVIALRKMEDAPSEAVIEAVYARLSDDVAWVVYDAAWFFKSKKVKNDKVLAKLKEIAGEKVKYSNDELEIHFDDISDADLQAVHEAARAVHAIEG
jgi:3-methyladenine DNA glycosylase AlkC